MVQTKTRQIPCRIGRVKFTAPPPPPPPPPSFPGFRVGGPRGIRGFGLVAAWRPAGRPAALGPRGGEAFGAGRSRVCWACSTKTRCLFHWEKATKAPSKGNKGAVTNTYQGNTGQCQRLGPVTCPWTVLDSCHDLPTDGNTLDTWKSGAGHNTHTHTH